MAARLEETLISVWRQAMVEDAQVVTSETKRIRCGGQADPGCARWTFVLTVTNCAGSSKTLKPALGGRNWRGKERRSCSFSAVDVTLRLWWTERCNCMERRAWRNWNARVEKRTSDLTVNPEIKEEVL